MEIGNRNDQEMGGRFELRSDNFDVNQSLQIFKFGAQKILILIFFETVSSQRTNFDHLKKNQFFQIQICHKVSRSNNFQIRSQKIKIWPSTVKRVIARSSGFELTIFKQLITIFLIDFQIAIPCFESIFLLLKTEYEISCGFQKRSRFKISPSLVNNFREMKFAFQDQLIRIRGESEFSSFKEMPYIVLAYSR